MAKSALESRLTEYMDQNKELTELIKDLRASLKLSNEREAAQLEEIKNLKEQIDYLTKKLFGKSSEKSDQGIAGQMQLDFGDDVFNEAEKTQDDSSQNPEDLEAEIVTFKVKRGRNKDADRYAGIPTQIKYLDIPEEERFCKDCGTALEFFGTTFVRRELVFKPASFKVVEYHSRNYRCPACTPDKTVPKLFRGKDGKAHMLHGMASASTVAWIMYQKYANAMPLYRQEKDFMQYGVKITRATLANWIIQNAEEFFNPFYEYLHRLLLVRKYVMADETTFQVLHEEDKRAESKSYMWLFRSGEDGDDPLILYKYSPTRAGETATEFLADYSGYLMCDGYSGYNKLKSAKRTSCWAHVRRYLIDAIPKGKKMDYTLPAVQGAMYIDQLFQQEKVIKAKYKTDFEAVRKARLEKEKPILEAFWSWFEKQNATKGSRMEKALTYISNRRRAHSTH